MVTGFTQGVVLIPEEAVRSDDCMKDTTTVLAEVDQLLAHSFLQHGSQSLISTIRI